MASLDTILEAPEMMIKVLPFSGNWFLAFWGLESPIQPRDSMAPGRAWSRAWRADLPVLCQDLWHG